MEGCDEAVQLTNDDASECKRSAVKLGYWQDDFLPILVRSTERKTPEINRGYYARTEGVSSFVRRFIKAAGNDCQIVSFGAGFDTLYWRLKEEDYEFDNYTEIDFPSVTSRKCYCIKRSKELLNHLNTPDSDISLSGTEVHSRNYHLVAADLRQVCQVALKLKESSISFTAPTLFLAECVLVYIEATPVYNLLSWIVSHFSSAFFVNYEQVNMGDRFGSIMLDNLRRRGCPLSGVQACQSLEAQVNRFLEAKWDGAKAWTMMEVYSSIPHSERVRIEKIEMLDEQELLVQLFDHYCISVAWKGTLCQQLAEMQITLQ